MLVVVSSGGSGFPVTTVCAGPFRVRASAISRYSPERGARWLACRWEVRLLIAGFLVGRRHLQHDGTCASSWFAKPDVQKKWWSLGGYSCHNAVLGDPGFADTAPFAADFLKAMSGVKDFWQEPAYASLMQSMQKRVHDFVVADKGTAQEALDKMIVDWTETFEDEGKL